MEKKVINEIKRIRQIMLLSEELIIENFATEIMTKFISHNRGFDPRVMIEIEQLDAFDTSQITRLRDAIFSTNAIIYNNFFGTFKSEFDQITDIAKQHKIVDYLADKLGYKTELDNVLNDIQSATNKQELNLAITRFKGNFNDPETQRFFEENLSKRPKGFDDSPTGVKGTVKGAMDEWQTIPNIKLNKAAQLLLAKKWLPKAIRQDLYNMIMTLKNVYVPYLREFFNLIRLRRPNFDKAREQIAKQMAKNITGKLKSLGSSGILDNKLLLEVEKYMLSIWSDVNTLRKQFKEANKEGLSYNVNIMDWFNEQLEKKGFTYDERKIILQAFVDADPVGLGKEELKKIGGREITTLLQDVTEVAQKEIDKIKNSIPQMIKLGLEGLNSFLLFGNPLIRLKELRKSLYARGLTTVYLNRLWVGILFSKVFMPFVVSFAWTIYQATVGTADPEQQKKFKNMDWWESVEDIFWTEFSSRLTDFDLMGWIWPWKTFYDNLWEGMNDALDKWRNFELDAKGTIENIGNFLQTFFEGVMGGADRFIQEVQNGEVITIPDDNRLRTVRIPADSVRSMVDTSTVDTSGGPIKDRTIVSTDSTFEEQ